MKKKSIFLLVFIMLVFGTTLYAQRVSDFQVTITDDFEGVIITKYTGTVRAVTIPAAFEGIPLREIGEGAFSEKNITSVIIPNGVITIGNGAFSWCRSLTSVTIPASVTTIGDNAFTLCTSLTSITIPAGVTTIGDYAFNGCRSLTSVTIPAGVTTIGDGAFSACDALRTINLPASIEHIGASAFSRSGLTSINWPAKVTVINRHVFQGCRGLTSITIPEGVTAINTEAFKECSALTTVVLPSTIGVIQAGAFESCAALTTITIPDSVTSIRFETNTPVTTTSFGITSVQNVLTNPFANCPRLNLASQQALRRRGWDPNAGEE